MPVFQIEQIALHPRDPEAAINLLVALGMDEWVDDLVTASGRVHGKLATNKANLHFNYQASPDNGKLELEVLNYAEGKNWMQKAPDSVSHLGMHVTGQQLNEWRKVFEEQGIPIVQEVFTESHTNPAIAGKRRYQYCIFGTRPILGVDLKFIVRFNAE